MVRAYGIAAAMLGVSLVGAPVLFFALVMLHSMVRRVDPGAASAANALIWIPVWWQWLALPYWATHTLGGALGLVASLGQLGAVATVVGLFTLAPL